MSKIIKAALAVRKFLHYPPCNSYFFNLKAVCFRFFLFFVWWYGSPVGRVFRCSRLPKINGPKIFGLVYIYVMHVIYVIILSILKVVTYDYLLVSHFNRNSNRSNWPQLKQIDRMSLQTFSFAAQNCSICDSVHYYQIYQSEYLTEIIYKEQIFSNYFEFLLVRSCEAFYFNAMFLIAI